MDLNKILAQAPISPTKESHSPIIFKRGAGPYIFDLNDEKYIDFMNGKGAVILGHNHAYLNKEIINFFQLNGDIRTGFTETALQYLFEIKQALGYEKSAYFKTGTEAVKAAVLSAKNYNKKDIILSAGYHGYDHMWKYSGALGKPNSNGIIDFFFDLDLLETLLTEYKDNISAIVISPDPLYLSQEWFKRLKPLTQNKQIILIADEVKVGFRYHFGLYSSLFDLKPDIAIVSKALANGYPLSVVCGSKSLLNACSSLNYTAFFDTLTFFIGNKVISKLKEHNFYDMLNTVSFKLIETFKNMINDFELPITIKSHGSLFQFVLPDKETSNLFYLESLRHNLIFYPEDNQCISYDFMDTTLETVLKEKLSLLFKALKMNPAFRKNKTPSLEWEIKTAWNLMDGLPNMKIPINVKEKILKTLPE